MPSKTSLGLVALSLGAVIGIAMIATPASAKKRIRRALPDVPDLDIFDDDDDDDDDDAPALTLDDIPEDPLGDIEIGEITIETPTGVTRQDVPLAVPVVRPPIAPIIPGITPPGAVQLPQDIAATPAAVTPPAALAPPANVPATVEDVIEVEHPDGTVEKLDPSVAIEADDADEISAVPAFVAPEIPIDRSPAPAPQLPQDIAATPVAVAPPVVVVPPPAPPVVIAPPPVVVAPPVIDPEPQTEVTAEEVEAPTPLPGDTATVIQEMLDDEKSAQWKRRYTSLQAWQGKRGLVADGMYGPTSALAMAEETGLLPIIRFWPRNSLQGVADSNLRRAYRVEATTAEEPRAAQLVAAADREQGQGFGRPQSPITPIIEI